MVSLRGRRKPDEAIQEISSQNARNDTERRFSTLSKFNIETLNKFEIRILQRYKFESCQGRPSSHCPWHDHVSIDHSRQSPGIWCCDLGFGICFVSQLKFAFTMIILSGIKSIFLIPTQNHWAISPTVCPLTPILRPNDFVVCPSLFIKFLQQLLYLLRIS